MLVKELLKKINIDSDDYREVKGISFDSNYIEDGYVFVAFKGNNKDGNDYIYKAFEKGAVCVVSDRLVGYDIYKSNNIDNDKETLIKAIYKNDNIKIIGITGTNGKTSTCHILYQALNKLGKKTCYIGTLGIIDGEYKKEIENTTPNMDLLAMEINKAIKRKCEYVVMEVSSHALSMNRVKLINFDIVAFTNLSLDHLDYHKDMESYFYAKKKLFDSASSKCIGIVNNEDLYSEKIIRNFKGKVIRYGKGSNYKYQVINSNIKGLKFKIDDTEINSKLILNPNIYNLSLAYVVLKELNIDKEKIKQVLDNVTTINGRMDVLYNQDYTIVLDYAHTPDAMERVIKEANKIKQNKTVVLFGCGGNRDSSKRKIMGKIADLYADRVYVTSDNPRFENEMDIINDILLEIENIDKVTIEANREKAISDAINSLKNGDILLILGKGHEEYQIIKDNKIHLSDREIVELCLKK